MLDVDGFIERSRDYLEKDGFFEKEIARRMGAFVASHNGATPLFPQEITQPFQEARS